MRDDPKSMVLRLRIGCISEIMKISALHWFGYMERKNDIDRMYCFGVEGRVPISK